MPTDGGGNSDGGGIPDSGQVNPDGGLPDSGETISTPGVVDVGGSRGSGAPPPKRARTMLIADSSSALSACTAGTAFGARFAGAIGTVLYSTSR